MWSVAASRKQNARPDPAPTKWSYRYQRLMLTPLFRRFLSRGLPALVVLGLVGGWALRPETQQMVADQLSVARAAIEARPEFAVTAVTVTGASAPLEADIRRILPVHVPVSQFDLDLADMRDSVAALHAVDSAALRIRSGGVLEVSVEERQPVALWRNDRGLALIDANGTYVGPVEVRGDRADLPLIIGEGADRTVSDAMALIDTAGPLRSRMRALVRIGDRRWDVILESGQRLLLPEQGFVPAFERVVALTQAGDLLERDFAVIDMRVPRRPTIRMSHEAAAALRDARVAVTEDN